MNNSCQRADCDIASDLPCEMGLKDPRECKFFKTPGLVQTAQVPGSETGGEQEGDRLPWTGRGLGLADLTLVSARAPTALVGFIGPFNAGKTGLLTAIYAHLARTGIIGKHGFAGSFSLQAWNQLKDHTKWPSANGGIFPPHTPDTNDRIPSLLHMAFRKDNEIIQDLLFTDAPGEWFTKWITNEAAENAAGARWISDNATHFVYVVDRVGLAGPDVGQIRSTTLRLARKLGESLRGRPIITVWAKSDETFDEEIEHNVRLSLNEFFGDHISLKLSVHDPECLTLLETVLNSPKPAGKSMFAEASHSAFLSYGGG